MTKHVTPCLPGKHYSQPLAAQDAKRNCPDDLATQFVGFCVAARLGEAAWQRVEAHSIGFHDAFVL